MLFWEYVNKFVNHKVSLKEREYQQKYGIFLHEVVKVTVTGLNNSFLFLGESVSDASHLYHNPGV